MDTIVQQTPHHHHPHLGRTGSLASFRNESSDSDSDDIDDILRNLWPRSTNSSSTAISSSLLSSPTTHSSAGLVDSEAAGNCSSKQMKCAARNDSSNCHHCHRSYHHQLQGHHNLIMIPPSVVGNDTQQKPPPLVPLQPPANASNNCASISSSTSNGILTSPSLAPITLSDTVPICLASAPAAIHSFSQYAATNYLEHPPKLGRPHIQNSNREQAGPMAPNTIAAPDSYAPYGLPTSSTSPMHPLAARTAADTSLASPAHYICQTIHSYNQQPQNSAANATSNFNGANGTTSNPGGSLMSARPISASIQIGDPEWRIECYAQLRHHHPMPLHALHPPQIQAPAHPQAYHPPLHQNHYGSPQQPSLGLGTLPVQCNSVPVPHAFMPIARADTNCAIGADAPRCAGGLGGPVHVAQPTTLGIASLDGAISASATLVSANDASVRHGLRTSASPRRRVTTRILTPEERAARLSAVSGLAARAVARRCLSGQLPLDGNQVEAASMAVSQAVHAAQVPQQTIQPKRTTAATTETKTPHKAAAVDPSKSPCAIRATKPPSRPTFADVAAGKFQNL